MEYAALFLNEVLTKEELELQVIDDDTDDGDESDFEEDLVMIG